MKVFWLRLVLTAWVIIFAFVFYVTIGSNEDTWILLGATYALGVCFYFLIKDDLEGRE